MVVFFPPKMTKLGEALGASATQDLGTLVARTCGFLSPRHRLTLTHDGRTLGVDGQAKVGLSLRPESYYVQEWEIGNDKGQMTKGVPIVYILLYVPDLMPWEVNPFLSWCHIAGSVSPWIGSFLYHLFMNINYSKVAYWRLLQLDMLGIWISQSFGAMPMVCASVFCLPYPLQCLIISSYCGFSIWGLFKAMTAWSPWKRRLCFALPFLMRALLCMLRYSHYGGGDPDSFVHVIMQDAVSVLGSAIGAMNIPEKWFPGSLDMYLNSHNIMHVLVVAAVYPMHQSTVRDLIWMDRGECKPIARSFSGSVQMSDF